jgi:predicted nucleic acid-binding protein
MVRSPVGPDTARGRGVPAHWPLEVANAFLSDAAAGALPPGETGEFIEDLAALPIRLEPPSGPAQWPAILALAERHRLTAYDAAYLKLAQRTGLPLATLDGDLQKAAQAEGVTLVEET